MFTTILVTGGAGYEVVVVDNLSNSKRRYGPKKGSGDHWEKSLKFYKADLLDAGL